MKVYEVILELMVDLLYFYFHYFFHTHTLSLKTNQHNTVILKNIFYSLTLGKLTLKAVINYSMQTYLKVQNFHYSHLNLSNLGFKW